MKILMVLFAAITLSPGIHAAPFADADPKVGKTLHDGACLNCHVKMFGGDGSRIYTRADRKVGNPQQLAGRISACNANTGAGWFPGDEAHVAAYLNQQYYKFK